MRKSLITRIEQANALIVQAIDLDLHVELLDGCTWPSVVRYTAPIAVKNQYVYVSNEDCYKSDNMRERYNTNNEERAADLRYELTLTIKSIKKAIRLESQEVGEE